MLTRLSIRCAAIRLDGIETAKTTLFPEFNMKSVCLGYADHSKFAAMSEAEMGALMEECFAYDDVLRQ